MEVLEAYAHGTNHVSLLSQSDARVVSRVFFVFGSDISRAQPYSVTLKSDSNESTRCQPSPRTFLCVTGHKERGVPTAARKLRIYNSVFVFSSDTIGFYTLTVYLSLTFKLRYLNSVFRAHGTKYICGSPLNRCACLTINVYKKSIEVD